MNTLVYMTTRIIEAYECICDKCDYKWSSINLPATCANKTCRTPRWNRELVAPVKVVKMEDVYIPTATVMPLAEKKSAEASPVIEQKLSHHDYVRSKLDPAYVPAKRETIEELKAMIAATPAHKSVLPVYTPPPIVPDQPDYYDEPFIE